MKKVAVFGDAQVGKTCLIQKFLFDRFLENYSPSFGTSVYKKNILVKDPSGSTQGFHVTLLIWDMPGSKQFTELHKAYYKGAEGGFVVMDATLPSTLSSAADWVPIFRDVVRKAPVILLVNKWDLVDRATFNLDPVRKVCKDLDIGYMFTSSKTGENVNDMFQNLTESMLQVRPF